MPGSGCPEGAPDRPDCSSLAPYGTLACRGSLAAQSETSEIRNLRSERQEHEAPHFLLTGVRQHPSAHRAAAKRPCGLPGLRLDEALSHTPNVYSVAFAMRSSKSNAERRSNSFN